MYNVVISYKRMLEVATKLINKLIAGQNLSIKESEQVFTEVFLHDNDGYHLAALSAAIHTKGETAEELLGFCRSTEKLGIRLRPKVNSGNITDLAGTGGGKIKTINVSTAAAFIVAAAGVTVGKQAVYAQTSPTGSADIFKAFGIDVFALKPKQVENALEQVGICPFYLSAMSPRMKNRSIIARRVFSEKGLRISSPFHLAALAYSPLPIVKRVYGCYDSNFLGTLAKLFMNMKYARTLVVHGKEGIPEASNIGKTMIAEQIGKQIRTHQFSPSDFGVKKALIRDIESGGKEQNILEFLRVLLGKWEHPKTDLVAINAGLALFVMNKAKNFREGTSLAKELLYSGKVAQKLSALVAHMGDKKKLEFWLHKVTQL